MVESQYFEVLNNIPNFSQVGDKFYRGGQPSVDDCLNLKKAGFSSIVSLRSRAKSVQSERECVQALNMKFFHLPLYYFRAPNLAEVEQFLFYLDDPQNMPLFVHCYHGVDRTGFIVATYRMIRDGWSFEQAYEEMVNQGFHKVRVRHYKHALKALSRRI